MVKLLPHANFSDDGNATVGTIYGGPFTGPDTCQETGLTFLQLDRDVTLQDAIASLDDGTAPAQKHAYLISVGDTQNVVLIIQSVSVPPNSNQRVVTHYKFKKGQTLYVRAVQLSEAGAAAAEATNLLLAWA